MNEYVVTFHHRRKGHLAYGVTVKAPSDVAAVQSAARVLLMCGERLSDYRRPKVSQRHEEAA